MKRFLFLTALLCLWTAARLEASPTCGDSQAVCGEGQHCCEHVIATFCKDQTCGYTFLQGQCLPKRQNCGDYWCGPQHCQSNWFSSKNVCCIYHHISGGDGYACTPSELNCRGNTQHLSIRPAENKESGRGAS